MVEFLIAATTVLIPLFLIVPILGKFMDMKSASIQAARYAAWERTVWFNNSDWAAAPKTDAQIQNEVALFLRYGDAQIPGGRHERRRLGQRSEAALEGSRR